jgi:hypothetical protein
VARLMWIEVPAPSRHAGIADCGGDIVAENASRYRVYRS